MSDRLVYDYMTIVTRMHSLQEIKDLLGISHLTWVLMPGRYCYPFMESYDSMVHIYYGASDEMGICVEFTGQGCRLFESFGSGDYIAVFKLVNQFPHKFWLTRLDIAYDDFDGLLIMDVVKDTLEENFLSKFHGAKIDVDVLRNGKKGYSVTFGKRSGDIMIRIYDKKTEQETKKYLTIDCPEGITSWTRVEIQFNKKRVLPMLEEFASQGYTDHALLQIYLGTLKNYLRFVSKPVAVRSTGDNDKRRWPTSFYWEKFVSNVEKLSLYKADHTPYTITKAKDNVFRNIGSIKALIEVMGVDDFSQVVSDSPYPRNPKYKNMVEQFLMNEAVSLESNTADDVDLLDWED